MRQARPCPPTVVVTQDEHAPTYWRLITPARALQASGAPVACYNVRHPHLLDAVASAEVMVTSRMGYSPGAVMDLARRQALAKKLGLITICDYDDDLSSPEALPQLEYMCSVNGQSPSDAERVRQSHVAALRLWDGVTVTTAQLADAVRPYTDAQIHVLPNAIDWEGFRAALGPTAPGPLTIGWVGGQRQAADLRALAPAWTVIAERHPEVRFRVAGWPSPALCAAVPPQRLQVQPWVPWAEYPRSYAGLAIACCPLAETHFNAGKSPIKAYEAAAAGALVVASPTVYGEVIRDGVTGYLAQKPQQWVDALEQAIGDCDLRHKLANRLAKEVRERHSLGTNLWRWPDAWAACLAQSRQKGARDAAVARS